MATFQQSLNDVGRIAGAFVVSLLSFVLIAAAQPPKPDVNTVERIQTVDGVVEIELHTNRPFPIRDQVIVLRIGTEEFMRSRHPEDGTLNTIIFMLSPEEFDQLTDGEPMTVKFGREKDGRGAPEAAIAARGLRWNFGTLKKALHQR